MGATSNGTENYFQKHSLPIDPVILGKTKFCISPVGFGCYRIHFSIPEHALALEQALLSGCNLIDTSTNYGDGGSEILVGQALEKLFKEKKLSRDEVVVVTKVGYVQGQNLNLAKKRIEQSKPFTDMVEYDPECWHCISPDFLEDQITRSLERLKLEKIDVLLLHNPEYFLKTHQDSYEYYRRIERAFEYLEEQVQKGRIQYYGISSNTFPVSMTEHDFTSLEKILNLAHEISHHNHFAVIQFPFNLFEAGAALIKNNSSKTVLELAASHQLGTLVNRPLNAFYNNQLIRLADFPQHEMAQQISQAIEESCPKTMTSKTLSQKVIRLYQSLSGLHCVLVGMRKSEYVKDIMNLEPPLPHEEIVQCLRDFWVD
jgi:hypothetical protein